MVATETSWVWAVGERRAQPNSLSRQEASVSGILNRSLCIQTCQVGDPQLLGDHLDGHHLAPELVSLVPVNGLGLSPELLTPLSCPLQTRRGAFPGQIPLELSKSLDTKCALWQSSGRRGSPVKSPNRIALWGALALTTAGFPAQGLDVLITGGTVYPDWETGPLRVDIGIVGDRIAEMGDLQGRDTAFVLDARGLLVVPGFIDTHSHADRGGPLISDLKQGITTAVVGNCGRSPQASELTAHWASIEGKLGLNHAPLIGHNTLRDEVGLRGTDPTPEQLEGMRRLVDRAMEAGAFGLSTGLIYSTGFNATTEEIVQLVDVVAETSGPEGWRR